MRRKTKKRVGDALKEKQITKNSNTHWKKKKSDPSKGEEGSKLWRECGRGRKNAIIIW